MGANAAAREADWGLGRGWGREEDAFGSDCDGDFWQEGERKRKVGGMDWMDGEEETQVAGRKERRTRKTERKKKRRFIIGEIGRAHV